MTKISEAAEKKALELEHQELVRNDKLTHYNAAALALARVLQEHSDVAKRANRLVYPETHRHLLESLILPEEPCGHQLDLCAPALGPGRCIKCGKRLKLTEVGDD